MKRHHEIRRSIGVSAVLLAALFLLPLAVVVPFRAELFSAEKTAQETEGKPFVPGDVDGASTLRVLCGDTAEEMTLGEYLVGVVRAEMPASFEEEALKAQAVAARTYTIYKIQTGGNHGDTADICTDSTCCQAYLGEEQARKNWGKKADSYEAKIRAAVRETDGETILYDGQPILAVFHSASAGRTRSAGSVWTSDLPYLQSVASPENGASIPNYYSRVEISASEFREKFLAAHPEADLSGPVSGWIANPVTDSAGSVDTVSIGGVTVRGTAVRSLFGLRSACFEWEVQGETIVFFVTGYGHGVGMSQYGANAMAREGSDHIAILTHYYTGTVVERYQPEL